MDNFEIFLEKTFKECTYRKDNSPLAELQYNIQLLTDRIKDMLRASTYKSLNEKKEAFTDYRAKYFDTLRTVITLFSDVEKSKKDIDEHFVHNVNINTESLLQQYDLNIDCIDDQEAKVINETVAAYQILLRIINTYIKNHNPELELLTVDEPLAYDKEPGDYLEFLSDFVKDQKKIRLED